MQATKFVKGSWHRVSVPITDLCRSPTGDRDRQLLRGDRFLVLETDDHWCFGRSEKDDYVGYISEVELSSDETPTHFICARATHEYPAPDIKTREIGSLGFGSKVTVLGDDGKFVELSSGTFVPIQHVRPLGDFCDDLVAVAEIFLGTPYLWGGNSPFGIDCSGLVQAALLATGTPCPGDSDQQMAVGNEVSLDAPYQRGDLVFWQGHVAIACDADTLIHANAHHMAVAHEAIEPAIARIAAQGDGPVIARRRVIR